MKKSNIFIIVANLCMLMLIQTAQFCWCSTDDSSKQETLKNQENLNIQLPNKIYAVEGMALEIFFDNLILSQDSDKYKYEMRMNGRKIGEHYRRKWVFSPSKKNVGKQLLEIRVIDPKDNIIKSKKNIDLIVSSKHEKLNVKILSIGDSLGHQSRFPSRLYDICKHENQNVKFLGTHFPKGSSVSHEHYGGWTWDRFLTLYKPGKKNIYHADRSPFVFLDKTTGNPTFDFKKYVSESLKGENPDVVIVVLGINDAWCLNPDDSSINQGTSTICENASKLLGAIHNVLPSAKIGLGMVIPANGSNRCFNDIYQDSTGPWKWSRIAFALNEAYLKFFAKKNYIEIIPINLGVDKLDHYDAHIFIPNGVDYDVTHVVHPNPGGDLAIAKSIYFWLCSTLSNS